MNKDDQSVARPSDKKVCLDGKDEYKISVTNNLNANFELGCLEMTRNDQSVARPSENNVTGTPRTAVCLAGRDDQSVARPSENNVTGTPRTAVCLAGRDDQSVARPSNANVDVAPRKEMCLDGGDDQSVAGPSVDVAPRTDMCLAGGEDQSVARPSDDNVAGDPKAEMCSAGGDELGSYETERNCMSVARPRVKELYDELAKLGNEVTELSLALSENEHYRMSWFSQQNMIESVNDEVKQNALISSMIPGRQKIHDSELDSKLNVFMMIEEIISDILVRAEYEISRKILPKRPITNDGDKKRKIEDCEIENLQLLENITPKRKRTNLQDQEMRTTPCREKEEKEKAPIENFLSKFTFKNKIKIKLEEIKETENKEKEVNSPKLTEKQNFMSKFSQARSKFEEKIKNKEN